MSETSLGYGPGARHEDRDLDQEQCWSLLGASGVGRFGFVLSGSVHVYPVNYLVLGGALYFRTTPGGTIAASLPQPGAALQTDSTKPEVQAGWTVLVQGEAAAVEDEDELTRLFGMAEEPWAPGVRDLFVRLAPARLAGRQVYLAR